MNEIDKTFKHLRYWIGILLVLSLLSMASGCATAGYEGVDTTRKAILVSTAEVREGNKLLQDLVRRNVIENDDAREVLSHLRDAHAVLQEALTIVQTNGDPATAETLLARANVTINIALGILSQFVDAEP